MEERNWTAIANAADEAERRAANEKAVQGIWLSSHEYTICNFGSRVFEYRIFRGYRMRPAAREAALLLANTGGTGNE